MVRLWLEIFRAWLLVKAAKWSRGTRATVVIRAVPTADVAEWFTERGYRVTIHRSSLVTISWGQQ